MDVVRRRLVVRGRVQGVWYRDSCRTEADRLGVSGWVRNRPDGSVEVAVEGGSPAVDRMVEWCHRGPRRASVASVEIVDEAPQGDAGFRIVG